MSNILSVSFAQELDETAAGCAHVCPEPHFLEAWGDSEPTSGHVSIRQPVLRPIGDTRQMIETLAAWQGKPAQAREIVRNHWQSKVHPRSMAGMSFDDFWNRTLHDGQAQIACPSTSLAVMNMALIGKPGFVPSFPVDSFRLELVPSLVVFDGRHAHNPWLLELPDPVAKSTWDNHAALGTEAAALLEVVTGDEIRLESGNDEALTLPVVVQPGQHPRGVTVSLGWGREGTDRFAHIGPQWLEGKPTVPEGSLVGMNLAPMIGIRDGSLSYGEYSVRVVKTGDRRDLALTQEHHSLFVPEKLAIPGHERRPLVQETTLASHAAHASEGSALASHAAESIDSQAAGSGEAEPPKHAKEDHHASLWPDHPKSPHHWGMVIDLTACTGCSACVIGCQAENNVPVVGRDEVFRAREMHWMRIDRYYGREGQNQNVDVVHQPMMCQHCDNAPCETVCPVQATAQSAEGLNQQVYNRCVGTRYCANNCPYKVRRFNWFEYAREDRLQNMVLNPDVTVRSRGVMEKCSMCVQRIQESKAVAKQGKRAIADGEIQPACAQSCPAQAITFGDRNDPESQLSHKINDSRHFEVLAELGIKPVVGYLSKVRNRTERSETDEHS